MNELLRYSRTFETTTLSHARLLIAWTEVRTERKVVAVASRRRLPLPHLGSPKRMAGPGLDRAGMSEAEAETQRRARAQVRRSLRGGSPSQLDLRQASRVGAEWLVLDTRLRWAVCSTHSGCSFFSLLVSCFRFLWFACSARASGSQFLFCSYPLGLPFTDCIV